MIVAGKYTVTDVAERRRFTAGGNEQLFYDIHIVTERGATGSVRIPAAEYEKEAIKKVLNALQVKLDQPFAL